MGQTVADSDEDDAGHWSIISRVPEPYKESEHTDCANVEKDGPHSPLQGSVGIDKEDLRLFRPQDLGRSVRISLVDKPQELKVLTFML